MNEIAEVSIGILLSGGIDSFYTTLLLKERYPNKNLLGIHFVVNDPTFDIQIDHREKCQLIAENFNIPLEVIDVTKIFRRKVIQPLLESYRKGQTPNPCIWCNPSVKFEHVYKTIKNKYATLERIATGHYAKLTQEADKYYLDTPKDRKKDQRYFLYQLNYDWLTDITFPLDNLTQEKVQKKGKDIGYLDIVGKVKYKSSMDICFLQNNNLNDFLKEHVGENTGDIVDIETKETLGTHEGLWLYTIGQRKGLGFAEGPYFVVEKDTENNILYITKKNVKEHLSSQKVTAQDINIINPDYTGLRKFECLSQIRYGSKKTKSKVTINDSRNQFQVKFNKPLIGVTPGQSVVLYDKNDRLVGGGIIDQTHSL